MFGQRKKRFILRPVRFFRRIETLVSDLIYISETDAEILPFAGKKADAVTSENLLPQIDNRTNAKVEEVNFEEFFNRLTTIKDWFGKTEKQNAEKFLALKNFLQTELKDLKVFKVGRIQIDIYAVGLDKNGNLAGIKTKAVET